MKILWIAKANSQDTDMQCDHLFHGLRSILGPDVVDVPRAWRAYADSYTPEKKVPPREKAFTFGGLLGDDSNVDRSDIVDKIKNRHFDYVFYGSVHRDKSFQQEVFSSYATSRIVLIDGEDETIIAPERGHGIYFKRELVFPDSDLLPIQFAIPKEKIVQTIPTKVRLMAPAPSTAMVAFGSNERIYSDEEAYYKQYSESYFGITEKKGGWNCLRHLEIIAAGCMPYFKGLEQCPPRTMELLPKNELLLAKHIHDCWEHWRVPVWEELMEKCRKVLSEHLTTEALANRVLCTVGAMQ